MNFKKQVSLEHLKEMLREREGEQRKGFFVLREKNQKIPKGSLIEVHGIGKTEWFIQFVISNSELRVLWIENEISIYPTAIEQRGFDLERILFVQVEKKEEFLWVMTHAMRSCSFEVIAFPSQLLDYSKLKLDQNTVLRRFQLLAKKTNTSVFILSEKIISAWPITTRIDVQQSKEIFLEENY